MDRAFQQDGRAEPLSGTDSRASRIGYYLTALYPQHSGQLPSMGRK
ncbi:hypothetical protein QQX40_28965 [Klebsiella pneumoniae]